MWEERWADEVGGRAPERCEVAVLAVNVAAVVDTALYCRVYSAVWRVRVDATSSTCLHRLTVGHALTCSVWRLSVTQTHAAGCAASTRLSAVARTVGSGRAPVSVVSARCMCITACPACQWNVRQFCV